MAHKRQPTPVPRDLPSEELTPEQWLGRALRAAREELGLSQEQVAQMMHVYGFDWHQTQVGRSEAATRPIRVNEAVALAEVLRIHPADLIGDIRDDWAAHTHILRLYARRQRLDDRVNGVQQELNQITWERSQLEEEIERAREFHAEAHQRRDRELREPERVRPEKYDDVLQIADLLREGNFVALDLRDMPAPDVNRARDFAAGVILGAGGAVVPVQEHLFLMCPPRVPEDVIKTHAHGLREE